MGFFLLGWRGTARNWSHYEILYLLLAGLSTPLVLSVHTIVSFDFAVAGFLVGTRQFFRLTLWPVQFFLDLPWLSL
jgi:hypothetical protein